MEQPKPDGLTILGQTLDRRKPLSDFLVFPCRVTGLDIKGNDRTRREVVEREMRKALAATTHSQLAVELARATIRLEETFKEAVCEVDIADSGAEDGAENDVKIAVHVQEDAQHAISYATAAKDGEGSIEVAWTMRHLLPRGERLRGAVSMGLNGSNAIRLGLWRPHAWEGVALLAEGFSEARADPAGALPRQQHRGVRVSAAQHGAPHSIAFEVSQRRWASPGVGEEPSLKVALAHRARADSRDDSALPSRGARLQHSFELAGFPCGAHFWREALAAEAHATRGRAVLSLCGSLGLLQGLGPEPSCVLDKHVLGGPGSLRGFLPSGAGPRLAAAAGGGPAGGDLSCMLGAAASWRLPLPAAWAGALPAARAQLWANAGSVVAAPQGDNVLAHLPSLLREMRFAAGASLLVPTAWGRLEVAVCRALAARESDRPARFHVRLESELD